MQASVAVRLARADDEADLFSLAKSAFGSMPAWRDRRTIDVLETHVVFVAEVGSSIAGYVAVERAGDSVRIDHLLVSPVYDDARVEARLLEYAEGYAISVTARTLQVSVEPDNPSARSFYLGHGFVPAGPELLELALPRR